MNVVRLAEKLSLSEVLRSGRQADPDGVEVRISRQAVEEAATQLERLTEKWTKCSKGLPPFNALVVAYLKGHKYHSDVRWHRDGWAFMVRHDEEQFTHTDARWSLELYSDALKRLDADELDVIQWTVLERP